MSQVNPEPPDDLPPVEGMELPELIGTICILADRGYMTLERAVILRLFFVLDHAGKRSDELSAQSVLDAVAQSNGRTSQADAERIVSEESRRSVRNALWQCGMQRWEEPYVRNPEVFTQTVCRLVEMTEPTAEDCKRVWAEEMAKRSAE